MTYCFVCPARPDTENAPKLNPIVILPSPSSICTSWNSHNQKQKLQFLLHKMGSSRQPEVLWAQRSDKVYLTIALPDARDVSVKCEIDGVFNFSAVGVDGQPFSFTLQLYANIVPEGCKTKIGLRNIICSIQKEKKGWWKRLLKSEEKPAPHLKVDWNKWCDEDDEESSDYLASDDDDIVHTGEDGSSDDEGMLYLPDLEKARGN